MGFFAQRLSNRLLEEIDHLASKPYRAADICRMIGELAEEHGLRRPSYEQVRQLVGEARRRPKRVSNSEVLLGVALRSRHPKAFLRHVSGTDTLQENK